VNASRLNGNAKLSAHSLGQFMGCSSSSPVGPAPPIGTLRSLQAATRGGPAALRKHFADVPFPAQPGLDAWAAALADAQAEGWARAVVAAVDALWTPLVAAVEKKLSDPEVSAAYDALTPRLLRLLLHQAAHGADAPPPDDADADAPLESPIAAGAPLWAGRAASEGLLRLGAALWAAHSAGSPAAAAEGAFASEALRRLLALLSIALCRTVGVEAPATFGAKLREWDATRAHFGLPRPALCALLDGPSKALLLYADGCAARGDGRVRVDVTRGAALWDALPQWEGTAFAHADADAVSMAIGGGGGGGAVDEIGDLEDELRALENELAGDEAPAAAAAAPAAADVATATARGAKLFPRFHGPNGFEAGEGHGPRKELFALVGQQLLNGAAASDSGVGGARRAILPYDSSARQHWFDARREGGARGLPHDEARLLRFCGWMIAQAILNRALQLTGYCHPTSHRHANDPPSPAGDTQPLAAPSRAAPPPLRQAPRRRRLRAHRGDVARLRPYGRRLARQRAQAGRPRLARDGVDGRGGARHDARGVHLHVGARDPRRRHLEAV
jgi:hypothetical protein